MIRKISKEQLPEEMKPFFEVWKELFLKWMGKFNFVPFLFDGEDKNLKALGDKSDFLEWYCFHPEFPEPYRDYGFYVRELTYLSKFMDPKVIVELGTNRGIGTYILQGLNPYSKLYTVDIKSDSGHFSKSNDVPCTYITGLSWETRLPEKFNFCFIDADHSEEAVLKDSEWAWNNKANDFMIVWHDVNNSEVIKGINRFCEIHNIDVLSLGDSHTAWFYQISKYKVKKEVVTNSLKKDKFEDIDYCMIVMKDIFPHVKLHFESLFRDVKPNLFKSYHVVDKGSKGDTISYCRRILPNLTIHLAREYEVKQRNGFPISKWQWDMAYSYDFCIRHCGKSEWIVISHPDLYYYDSRKFYEGINELLTPDVGVVNYCAWCAIRREVYLDYCHLGMWPLMGVGVCKNLGNDNFLISNSDPRFLDEKSMSINGIEMFELFFIEAQTLGWNCIQIDSSNEELYFTLDHMSGCTGHDMEDKPEYIENNLKRVEERLKEFEDV